MREQDQTLAYRLHIDMPLLLGLIVLSAVGLLVLYSAGGQSNELLTKQVVRLGVAFGVMFVVAQIGPSHYQYWSPWIYGIGLILLVLVLVAGDQGKGAQRWLDIGFVRFQPSELVKISVPMMVAYYLSERPIPPTWQRVLIGLAAVLLPTVLIARQPDLGTALLVASLPIMMTFLHDYQRQRVETFLNPERDPLGSGYHIIQSKIAIGSGGLTGRGYLRGTQNQLNFLPEQHSDFIFSVFSEEWGFVGAHGPGISIHTASRGTCTRSSAWRGVPRRTARHSKMPRRASGSTHGTA